MKSFRHVNFPEEAGFLLERTESVCGRSERLLGGCLCRKEDGLIYSRCEAGPGTLARCLYGLCFVTGLCCWWELCSASQNQPLCTHSQEEERGQPAASAQPRSQNQASKTKCPAHHDEFPMQGRPKAAPAARLGEPRAAAAQGTGVTSLCQGHSATTCRRRGQFPSAFVSLGGRESGRGAAFPLRRNCKVLR